MPVESSAKRDVVAWSQSKRCAVGVQALRTRGVCGLQPPEISGHFRASSRADSKPALRCSYLVSLPVHVATTDTRVLLLASPEAPAWTQVLERSGVPTTTVEQLPASPAQTAHNPMLQQVVVVDMAALVDARVWLAEARRRGLGIIAITEPDAASVGEAVTLGADLCLTKPIATEALAEAVARVSEKLVATHDAARYRSRAQEVLELGHFDQVVGTHPQMQQLLSQVAHVAPTRATVLIHGESGTGKELIAAAIHQNSKRSSGPFVRLNCAALAETVLESELFGHEKGAFTGAATQRDGRFAQADGGTLFLDEASEIPPGVQVKLLRFLQERAFERVGGNHTLRVDVRVVAATNRDLKQLVDEGRFRADLYYRLNVVRLNVPTLRARPSDILTLAQHFLNRFAKENERRVTGFSDAAKKLLTEYPWPGNVRELENAIEQAVVLTRQETIDVDALPLEPATPSQGLTLMIPGTTLAEIERYATLQTLQAVNGSVTRAAAILDISRRTLQYRLKEWGVSDRLAGYSAPSSEQQG